MVRGRADGQRGLFKRAEMKTLSAGGAIGQIASCIGLCGRIVLYCACPLTGKTKIAPIGPINGVKTARQSPKQGSQLRMPVPQGARVPRLEYTHRSAVEDHVHRPPRLGPRRF
jgi:hypothetical protein